MNRVNENDRNTVKLKVKLFLGDNEIKESEISNVRIVNKTVDRIVNAVVERNCRET